MGEFSLRKSSRPRCAWSNVRMLIERESSPSSAPMTRQEKSYGGAPPWSVLRSGPASSARRRARTSTSHRPRVESNWTPPALAPAPAHHTSQWRRLLLWRLCRRPLCPIRSPLVNILYAIGISASPSTLNRAANTPDSSLTTTRTPRYTSIHGAY